MKTLQDRYQQANKEAKWAILLSFAYFVWWYASAYGLSSPLLLNQSLPTLYFGLPLWFLLSCIIGPTLFVVLCALMVKFIYRDISLDVEKDNNDN